MARYFAPGEHLTYDDFLSLRQELFGELETYLHERFNLFDRVDDLERDVRDIETEAQTNAAAFDSRIEALEDSFPADLEESA